MVFALHLDIEDETEYPAVDDIEEPIHEFNEHGEGGCSNRRGISMVLEARGSRRLTLSTSLSSAWTDVVMELALALCVSTALLRKVETQMVSHNFLDKSPKSVPSSHCFETIFNDDSVS